MTIPFKRTVENLLAPSRSDRRRQKCLLKEQRQRGRVINSLLWLGAVCLFLGFMAVNPVLAVGAASLPVMGLQTPRLVNYVPGIQGVAAGGVGTINAQVDRRYHTLRILTTNTAGALTDPTTIVSLVELVVNGVTIRSGLPATFINIAKTFRYTPGTGEIPIFFSEFWRDTPRSIQATSWDLFGQQTFVIRLTFLSPGGGVGVQSVLADFDGERNLRPDGKGGQVPFLAIVKQFDNAINAVSGTNNVVTIPTNFPLQRIFLDVSANAVSSVQIFADNNVKVFESTKTENQYMLGANDLTGTFFEFPIVFDYNNDIGCSLKTSYLNLQVVTTGALTLTAHVQQMVPGFR